MNDDLFLAIHTYEPEGTMEQRWGPLGTITCSRCDAVWPCHWFAFRQGHSVHSKDFGDLTWIPWEKSQEHGPLA